MSCSLLSADHMVCVPDGTGIITDDNVVHVTASEVMGKTLIFKCPFCRNHYMRGKTPSSPVEHIHQYHLESIKNSTHIRLPHCQHHYTHDGKLVKPFPKNLKHFCIHVVL